MSRANLIETLRHTQEKMVFIFREPIGLELLEQKFEQKRTERLRILEEARLLSRRIQEEHLKRNQFSMD